MLLLLVSLAMVDCNPQQRNPALGESTVDATSLDRSALSKYREQILTLKGKIKHHEASVKEMLALCEMMLKDKEIKGDEHSLGEVYLQYSLYLEADGQFDKAEDYSRKAEKLVLRGDKTRMQPALASIYMSLARIYQDKKQ